MTARVARADVVGSLAGIDTITDGELRRNSWVVTTGRVAQALDELGGAVVRADQVVE